VATEVLTRSRLDAFPRAFDVVRTSRSMNQTERGPDRMITTQHETVFDAAQYRLHAATICFDSRRARIVKATAVNRAPEVRIELEVGAAPITLHDAEELFEMLLHFRMRAVEHVPWTTPPTTKCDAIRPQRFPLRVFHKPIGMLLKDFRFFFSDERRDPDGRLKTTLANLFQDT